MAKTPWVLIPAGPLGWKSHEQIMPVLSQAWTMAGARLEKVWFPRPKVKEAWLNEIRENASILVFPLGIGHYDALWLLSTLRLEHKINIPAIIMVASDLTKGFRALFDYKNCLTSRDIFVTNCEAERELVLRAFQNSVEARRIPLPVDDFFFKVKKEQKIFKSDGPMLLYAGRVSAQKNIHGLIRIFAEFRKEKRGKLFILGSSDDVGIPHFRGTSSYRYIHELSALVNSLDLEDHVVFKGNLSQEELAQYFLHCDLHLSATLHSGEDFGYSIAQGLCAAAPTLVSEWGGGRDFVRSGGALGIPTFMTENGPRINYAKALENIFLISDSQEKNKLRERALNYARRNLSLKAVAHQWRNLFEEMETNSNFRVSLKISPLFNKKFPKPFHFKSPKDPLYLLIGEIYSGQKQKQKQMGYLHPLFSIGHGFLADPIAPIKDAKLTQREKSQLLKLPCSAFKLKRIKNNSLNTKLKKLGILLG